MIYEDTQTLEKKEKKKMLKIFSGDVEKCSVASAGVEQTL